MKVIKRLVAISTAVMLFLLCFSLVGCTHVSKEVKKIVGKWEPYGSGKPFEITSKGEFIVDEETYEIKFKEQGMTEGQVEYKVYTTTYSEYPEIVLSAGNLSFDSEDGLATHLWWRVKD